MSNVVHVKETPPLKRIKCNSIANVRKWEDTFELWVLFAG